MEPAVLRPEAVNGRRIRIALILVVALGVLVYVTPVVMVEIGTREAVECLAKYGEPRGAEHPDCLVPIRYYVWPSRIPWTAHPASYRAEELFARAAFYDFIDASIGAPDPKQRARAAEELEHQAEAMKRQSQRVVIEELGPAIGTPDLGRDADLFGDRKTLIDNGERWLDWPVRVHTMQDALVEANLPRAIAIARHYSTFDPRDEDQRAMIAALICLGGEAQRGVNFLRFLQDTRSSERHESFARDYGDVRWLMVACAARGNVQVPPKPVRSDAGRMDHVEERALLQLKLLGSRPDSDPAPLYDAVHTTLELLEGERSPGMRAMLIAALASSGYASFDPVKLASLAAPLEAEAPILPPSTLTALEWISERRGTAPVMSGKALALGADGIEKIAKSSILRPDAAARLRAVESAAAVRSVRAFALEGDVKSALAMIPRTGDAMSTDSARAVARSSVLMLAGQPAEALDELAAVAAAAEPMVKAAAAVQRAELLATLGKRDEASAAAIAADDAARASGDARLDLRARWTRLALAKDRALRPEDEKAAADRFDPKTRAFVWATPEASDEGLKPESIDPTRLSLALVRWDAARRAPSEEQRALRYAAMAHRGDIPFAYPAYLVIAGELLRDGDGDRETWLDAITDFDPDMMTFRAYAFARAQAARWRGDAKAADLWWGRYVTLREIVSDPANAELARFVGI